MDLLPDEILDMIFQYFSTPELVGVCVPVSKRWQRVVEMRVLALRDDGDERRLHRGIHAVLLTTFPVDLSAMIEDITTKARFLRELTAHAPASFHEQHVEALNLLPHLIHLDIFTKPRLLDQPLAAVCKRLRTLVANESMAPGLLRALSTGSQLVALHMYGRSLHYPRREMLAVLRDRAPYLRELTLRCNELPDAAYDTIGDCYNLRELQLYSCWMLTGVGARAICRPQRLRLLHVTGAKMVRRQPLADMIAELPDGIEELALSSGWFCDDHVRILLRRGRGLRVLELWDCKLSTSAAQELAFGLPKLQQLDLDLTLSTRRLQRLARHPSLRRVRCVPADAGRDPEQYMEDHPQWEVDGLQVVATYAPYERKYFRASREGYRSSLFYFWTRQLTLKPLPPLYSRSGFEPYDRDDFF